MFEIIIDNMSDFDFNYLFKFPKKYLSTFPLCFPDYVRLASSVGLNSDKINGVYKNSNHLIHYLKNTCRIFYFYF